MNLATFVDRDTLVYERVYAHPIERVWEAVSTGEHLSAWLMPRVTVERREGGTATFTWGGTDEDDPFDSYVVGDLVPPTSITFASPPLPAYMRFELSSVDAASTRLRFTLHWPAPDDVPSPWLPETLSTFHQTLDRLGDWLAGASPADLAELSPPAFAAGYAEVVAAR